LPSLAGSPQGTRAGHRPRDIAKRTLRRILAYDGPSLPFRPGKRTSHYLTLRRVVRAPLDLPSLAGSSQGTRAGRRPRDVVGPSDIGVDTPFTDVNHILAYVGPSSPFGQTSVHCSVRAPRRFILIPRLLAFDSRFLPRNASGAYTRHALLPWTQGHLRLWSVGPNLIIQGTYYIYII
jgi:hypothetical protein